MTKAKNASLIGKMVVVRSSPSGVWFGVLIAKSGQCVTLRDARRAWSWTGAASCAGLATHGPSGGKITAPVAVAVIEEICETLATTERACARWEAVAPWVVS